ncbi:Transposase IS200 like protein [Pseudobythopirellula maris]|uniref:Transposase IS200 like protein n=1 Tax=Pseudobythopirellula maris TaxID=2527991 RepID=A0A5C5ZQ69_9BACT|nr:transposase [Pseudobythopirellula maris]TWT89662.1 Transposase IS200 like protein [Pseudobythopirellula maris]
MDQAEAVTNYRRARIEGGTYFFTVITHERRPFLASPLARSALRQAIRSVRSHRPFTIDAIVLLPDHLHTVWTLPRGDDDYSTRWRQIKSLFTKAWLRSGGDEGDRSVSRQVKGERGVWHRRMFEHACRDEADMKRCVDYLHANPLKHGLVSLTRDWPWSSFHRCVRLGEYPADWGSAAEWYGDEWAAYE